MKVTIPVPMEVFGSNKQIRMILPIKWVWVQGLTYLFFRSQMGHSLA